jgi:fibronectin type 3 domain-containing protein
LNWAKDVAYKRYGYGDDRPILILFDRAEAVIPLINSVPANKTNYFSRFHIGTEMVNISTTPGETDCWGYRNFMQNSTGSIRFASPESGLAPTDPWVRISEEEWIKRVDWCKSASEYSIYGSYDDVNDCIHWGIFDTKKLPATNTTKKYPDDDPWVYYNVVRGALKPRAAGNMLPTQNLVANVKKDTVELSWDKNQENDFGAYRIYRSIDNNHSFKLFAYGVKPNNFTDSGFIPGKTYYYTVTTVDTLMGFESEFSDTVKVTPNIRVLNKYKFDFNKADNTEGWTGNPDIGGLLQVISQNGLDGVLTSDFAISGNDPRISFQSDLVLDNPTDAWAVIEVRLRQIGSDGSTPQTWDSQGSSVLIQYLNAMNLGELKTPEWRIKSEAGSNWIVASSDISEIGANTIKGISIDPIGNNAGIGKNFELDYVYLKTNAPMAVPDNLIANDIQGAVSLSWDRIQAADIINYRIYRNTVTGGPYQFFAITSNTGFVDQTIITGLTYYYVVSALDSLGNESGKSSEVKIQTKNNKQMACYQFEFNTSGNIEGWTGNPDVNQLTQATGINGIDGVAKSIKGISGIDPMLFYNSILKLPTATSKWISLEMRVRQLNATQVASQPWNPQGTIGYFVAPDPWIVGEIKAPAFEVSSEPTGDWINVKLDISRIGSTPITSIRLDFIGDSPGIGKNFELDYVRMFCTPYDLVPPATPTGFQAVAGNSRVKLNWDDNTESDLMGYNIYRSNQSGRPPTKYKSSIKISEYADTLLYFKRVK